MADIVYSLARQSMIVYSQTKRLPPPLTPTERNPMTIQDNPGIPASDMAWTARDTVALWSVIAEAEDIQAADVEATKWQAWMDAQAHPDYPPSTACSPLVATLALLAIGATLGLILAVAVRILVGTL